VEGDQAAANAVHRRVTGYNRAHRSAVALSGSHEALALVLGARNRAVAPVASSPNHPTSSRIGRTRPAAAVLPVLSAARRRSTASIHRSVSELPGSSKATFAVSAVSQRGDQCACPGSTAKVHGAPFPRSALQNTRVRATSAESSSLPRRMRAGTVRSAMRSTTSPRRMTAPKSKRKLTKPTVRVGRQAANVDPKSAEAEYPQKRRFVCRSSAR
jgi:hypothetical protein